MGQVSVLCFLLLDIAGVDARLETEGCMELARFLLEEGVDALEKSKVCALSCFLFLSASPVGCSLLLRFGRGMDGRFLEMALIGFIGLGLWSDRVVALSLPFLMILVEDTAGLCGRKKGISMSSYFSALVSKMLSVT